MAHAARVEISQHSAYAREVAQAEVAANHQACEKVLEAKDAELQQARAQAERAEQVRLREQILMADRAEAKAQLDSANQEAVKQLQARSSQDSDRIKSAELLAQREAEASRQASEEAARVRARERKQQEEFRAREQARDLELQQLRQEMKAQNAEHIRARAMYEKASLEQSLMVQDVAQSNQKAISREVDEVKARMESLQKENEAREAAAKRQVDTLKAELKAAREPSAAAATRTVVEPPRVARQQQPAPLPKLPVVQHAPSGMTPPPPPPKMALQGEATPGVPVDQVQGGGGPSPSRITLGPGLTLLPGGNGGPFGDPDDFVPSPR